MQPPQRTLYLRRDNVFELAGVKNALTGDLDDSLSLSLRAVDLNGVAIANGTATMINTAPGVYRGTLDKACALESLPLIKQTAVRRFVLYVDEASYLDARKIECEAIYEGWHTPPIEIYTRQVNWFTLAGVTFPDGSGFDNSLDPTFTLYEAPADLGVLGGAAIANGSMSLASASATGDYRGPIPGNAATQHGKNYVGFIEDAATGRCWAFQFKAKDRGLA